jgi:glycosyltransferase involved in cell wall biosynthesis
MTKKRILMCAEAHDVNSGFGRYTKEILTRLYNNPNYEVAEFASYFNVGKQKTVPWKVYPNAVEDSHPEAENYKKNPINQFGLWRFDKVVLHFKPDIVFDIRDYWMFAYQELSPLRKYFHWVVVPTIDSIPQKTEWLKTFENADVVMTHTDWAENYLGSLNRPINLGGCASDSVDSSVFKPISWTKNFHKAKYNLPTNSFIIGSVMRNQKRKLIAELFNSLRDLLSKSDNKNIYLYLHTSYPEAQGWNIPELLQEYGVYNNVLFTYYCVQSQKIIISPFKGIRFINENNEQCTFPNVVYGVSNEQLCEIYNLFDIYVQYAICEGLGIPQLEAASCGIPIFAVNYSGMEEITTKVNGIKINHLLAKELETGSDRATPDNKHLVSEILKWMNKPQSAKKAYCKQTRELLMQHYSWDITAGSLSKVFDSLDPKNLWDEPLSLNQSVSVPIQLANRDFIDFIIDQIIMEPNLKNTYFVQNIIKNLDEACCFLDQNGIMQKKQEALKTLEMYMNNKIVCEQIRSGQYVPSDDFLFQ